MYSNAELIISLGLIGAQDLWNLADKVHRPGVPDDADALTVINGAIAQADAMIDGRLGSVYEGVLPLTSPPVLVQYLSARIAAYKLWESTQIPHEDNPRAYDYELAMRELGDVATGRLVLVLSPGTAAEVRRDVSFSFGTGEAGERKYTRNRMRGWF